MDEKHEWLSWHTESSGPPPRDGQAPRTDEPEDVWRDGAYADVFSGRNEEPAKRKTGKITRVIIFAAALLAVCAAVWVLFSHYSVKVLSEEGKITFSISRKMAGEPYGASAENRTVQPDAEDGPREQRTRDDGTRLSLMGAHSDSGERSFQDIYSDVVDSVVCISVETASGESSASGIIMSENGYIITSAGSVAGASEITVTLHSGEEYVSSLVGSDSVTDLAVLKIDREGCSCAVFADSDEVRVGDAVLAIGNPLGAELAGTLTDGIVCAFNRGVYLSGHLTDLIQTNAAVYDGSAGGPLINMRGEVIGIITVKAVDIDSSVQGLGFAIPSRSAKPIIDELIEKGYISGRPSLGFVAIDYNLPAQAAVFFGTPGGVMVSSVYETSDAYTKGVRAGDIVVAVQGTEVYSVSELTKVISQYPVGDSVTIIIYRKGAYYQADLTLAEEASFRSAEN